MKVEEFRNLQIKYFYEIHRILIKYNMKPISVYYQNNYIVQEEIYYAVFVDPNNHLHALYLSFNKNKTNLLQFERAIKEIARQAREEEK